MMTKSMKKSLDDCLIDTSTKKPYPDKSSFVPSANSIEIIDEDFGDFERKSNAKTLFISLKTRCDHWLLSEFEESSNLRKITTDSRVHDAGTTMETASISTMSRTNAPQAMTPAEKAKKFAGINFKRWQQKMFFYLTTLCLQSFTFDEALEVLEGTSEQERFVIVEAWKHSDFLCRNYILSGLQK
ncbi:hypothetical protein FXO38_27846 [Capsicum annuum]|uniref:Uncharacterized protein n=1 Tax=Capsicum annuum TaxID=4072 RepID=A0A2G2YEH7_CAPAN|nr:hypothetical protein FXO38_27846 [Capsicum annuum]PHT68144.1 hypothetical protein T459_27631 [Capsicum annuum]